MAYSDIYEAATDSLHVLRKQTAVALHKAAVDVVNESAATAHHGDRLAWALAVLRDPVTWAGIAIWKVLENVTIAAAPTAATDSDVQFVVNSLVDTLTGAR